MYKLGFDICGEQATYENIKEYVLGYIRLKIISLYIIGVKREIRDYCESNL